MLSIFCRESRSSAEKGQILRFWIPQSCNLPVAWRRIEIGSRSESESAAPPVEALRVGRFLSTEYVSQHQLRGIPGMQVVWLQF